MPSFEDWELLRNFAERGPAEAFCALLENDGVPTRVQANSLENAIEARFSVLVPNSLLHRAKWVSEYSISEGELNYLATGKLSAQE